MKIEYTFNSSSILAQAYGGDSYGTEQYGDCVQTSEGCVVAPNGGGTTTTTETPPNTGFLGLSQDAALASVTGALLVAIAIVGAVYVIVSRRRNSKKTQE